MQLGVNEGAHLALGNKGAQTGKKLGLEQGHALGFQSSSSRSPPPQAYS